MWSMVPPAWPKRTVPRHREHISATLEESTLQAFDAELKKLIGYHCALSATVRNSFRSHR
jgi:hypothetical protein